MTRNKHGLTDAEEAEIQAQIAADSEDADVTDEELAKAKSFGEAFPDLMESIKRGRGRPKLDNPKEAVTLRLDPETLAKFKAKGKDWRARMSEVLEKTDI
jgi:uncharacterized protein (DUF4415 family)